MAEAGAEIGRLRGELATQSQREDRRRRIEEVISDGLRRLDDPDSTAANVWLRAHLRLWTEHQKPKSIELL